MELAPEATIVQTKVQIGRRPALDDETKLSLGYSLQFDPRQGPNSSRTVQKVLPEAVGRKYAIGKRAQWPFVSEDGQVAKWVKTGCKIDEVVVIRGIVRNQHEVGVPVAMRSKEVRSAWELDLECNKAESQPVEINDSGRECRRGIGLNGFSHFREIETRQKED
ncbi:hypothetical protein BDN72DRAFT_865351 [Pluteus cervinus]|uniref:Uncharacterized protein n=1 Tax=Pluteus cervinus TaxID=181527 RepID=A0ACD3A0M4_9AGAR|nr:hypothetical protein BDN72DRAFT_865351 [Pluteus cervinus]